ncbi:(Fe-S)-binding protein [Hominifimenecus sp. rT4P-3]|uniref:(Fe-S)-binding protein n=1 Tax=Hominifimenecus sp. rT4P-3 TaxID=3242979 RepID=UPI003DA4AACA
MDLADEYRKAEQKLISSCVYCGNCVKHCKMMEEFEPKVNGRETQKSIVRFLKEGAPLSGDAKRKLDACMRCYGCMDIRCPIGVDSLTINELVWMKQSKHEGTAHIYEEHHRIIEETLSAQEQKRVRDKKMVPGAKIAFFPGCNVYKTPQLLLHALDLMDYIGEAYSYLPGIEYCCGGGQWGMTQDVGWMEEKGRALVQAAVEAGCDTLVCWCPTCCVYLQERIGKITDIPFSVIPMASYLAMHMERFETLKADQVEHVAVHEPCKAVYRGISFDGFFQLLSNLSGVTVETMAHQGKETLCCGCRAVGSLPELGDAMTEKRLEEAKQAGADRLITICHFCQCVLGDYHAKHPDCGPAVENYADYLTRLIKE